MKIDELINRATKAGYEIVRKGNDLYIHRKDKRTASTILLGVWITLDEQNRLVSAVRTDIDLTLTTAIRSVVACARILDIE